MNLDFDQLFWVYRTTSPKQGGGRHSWTDSTLHASDLGMCPRQTAFRLLGAPKRKDTPEREYAQFRMFEESHDAEDDATDLLKFHGVYVDDQVDISDDVMTRQLDFICSFEGYDDLQPGNRVVDWKQVNPEMITRERALPKPHNRLQVIDYHKAATEKHPELQITQNPMLVYWPVHGRAPSRWYEIDPELYEDDYQAALDELLSIPEMVKRAEVPGRLSRQAKIAGREPNKTIVLTTDWRCSWMWCPYMIEETHPERGGLCTPMRSEKGHKTTTVAKWTVSDERPAGGWVTTDRGTPFVPQLRTFLAREAELQSRCAMEELRKLARSTAIDYDDFGGEL